MKFNVGDRIQAPEHNSPLTVIDVDYAKSVVIAVNGLNEYMVPLIDVHLISRVAFTKEEIEGIEPNEMILDYSTQVGLYRELSIDQSDDDEVDRLRNLLTACYNCDSIKEVKKIIEAEIAGEE